MKQPARVLVIGNDETLAGAIARVLTHFWTTRTLVRTSESEAEAAFLEDDDLVVLCDSFSEQEHQVWVDRVRLISSRLLVVKINGYDAGPHAGADATVDYDHGPGALVSTIYELLTERGLASRSWSEPAEPAWVQ